MKRPVGVLVETDVEAEQLTFLDQLGPNINRALGGALRGIYRTGPDGRYEIRSVRPGKYPIPHDGPVGVLLKANNRGWMRPGHLHTWVKHPGYKELITHIFDRASDHLYDDAVFGVRESLIVDFTPDADGELNATFDFVLDPA